MLLSAEDGPNPSLEASGFIAVKGLRVRPLLIGWGFFRDVFFPLVLLEMQRHTNRKGEINKHL